MRVGTFLAIWNIQLSEIHWNDTLHVSQVSTRSGKAGDQRPPTPCGCLVCSWRLGKHTSHQFAVLGSVCGTFDSLDKDLDRDRVICNFMWNTCFLIATYLQEKKILADAKYLGLVEFVQGPIMEGQEPCSYKTWIKAFT